MVVAISIYLLFFASLYRKSSLLRLLLAHFLCRILCSAVPPPWAAVMRRLSFAAATAANARLTTCAASACRVTVSSCRVAASAAATPAASCPKNAHGRKFHHRLSRWKSAGFLNSLSIYINVNILMPIFDYSLPGPGDLA